jgi:hypothetical protein
MQLEKANQQIKTGNEKLVFNHVDLKDSILDFWRWSVSDVLSNATRGIFAEFIVATATRTNLTTIRDEWAAYDLETPSGIKLEIKSSAYLQTWAQKSFSKISFRTKPSKQFDFSTNKYSTEKSRSAEVYVFCLLNHKDKATVNPLNLNQWEFYVLSTKVLNNYIRSQNSITLKSLQALTSAVYYDGLNHAIIESHDLNF